MTAKSHRYDAVAYERERQLRAAKGPTFTFNCPGCGKVKGIVGRRLVKRDGKRTIYHCAICLAGSGSIFTPTVAISP